MATFSKFLRSIYRDGNEGKQFERFVKWFLTHDPEWSTQVDKVWLWDEWPDRWGRDKGIDLIFKHRTGSSPLCGQGAKLCERQASASNTSGKLLAWRGV